MSDPRCEILKEEARKLSVEKGIEEKYNFYVRFETLGLEALKRKTGKESCANVDFYSGLIYD